MSSLRENRYRTNNCTKLVKITKNGPYIISGNIPLIKAVIEADEEGYPFTWNETEKYSLPPTYRLCRCGKSENKPYCDNHHKITKFDGKETAQNDDFMDNAKTFDGPELILLDNKELCVGSGFCTRAGNIWNLTTNSDNPKNKVVAIQEASDCPSGRLVLYDKEKNSLEPLFEQSIVVTEDEEGIPGPLWIRGGIQVNSVINESYQKRNRVSLCRCGRSQNKPLCDGSHLDEE